MSGISSSLKTWLKRNKFRHFSYGRNHRTPMRKCNGYVVARGRMFRFREYCGLVDIGDTYAEFDRWANSTITTVSIRMFMEWVEDGVVGSKLKEIEEVYNGRKN